MPKEEKIKEIISKYVLDGKFIGLTPEDMATKALKEYGDYIRQQTLEEAIRCVKKQERVGYTTTFSDNKEHDEIDREQTITNLNKLK